MLAFVSQISFLTKSRVPVLTDKRHPKSLALKASRSLRPTIRAQARSAPEHSDDDDESFGSASGFGMRLPNMPEKERQYLNAATSDKDFIERMKSVARRMDQLETISRKRSERQSADDYIESLNRITMHTSESRQKSSSSPTKPVKSSNPSPPSTPLSSRTPFAGGKNPAELSEPVKPVEEENVDDIEARIQQLNRDLMNVVSNEEQLNDSERLVDHKDYTAEELAENAAQLDALQKQIQSEIGDRAPDVSSVPSSNSEPPMEPAPRYENPDVVDKQIAFLEGYLEKLKLEAETEVSEKEDEGDEYYEDPESVRKAREEALSLMEEVNKKSTMMPGDEPEQVQFDGLQDSPGGMTAEEKKAAFESLRQRAMMQQQPTGEFSDPYNITLPEKTADVPNFDDGDVPTGDESEYDSYAPSPLDSKLLIEEIRMEMKSYTDETRRLLRNHESRMNTLLTRLIASTLNE